MENHPIPQDITGFEFKLIGDMTLKQFAYIAAGGILGVVCYTLPLLAIIKIPLALVFVGIGVAFAFVPFEGRPLDVMIKNFLKAVLNPTQYVYQKMDNQLVANNPVPKSLGKEPLDKVSHKQFTDFLGALQGKHHDEKDTVFFEAPARSTATSNPQPAPGFVPSHSVAVTAQPSPMQTLVVTPITPEPNKKISDDNLQKTAALLEQQLQAAKAKEAVDTQVNPDEYLKAHQKVLELQKNLNDLAFQKQELESRLISLQNRVDMQGKTVYSPSVAHPEQLKETKFVRSIPQNMQKSAGMPIASEFPNVITGIIKDPRENPLQNILVEVKDPQGNAVRAFKTNALGQFASATPLINGDYSIEFEDPKAQNKFDTVAFKANGEIILPIEIISVDQREELRRSLFN